MHISSSIDGASTVIPVQDKDGRDYLVACAKYTFSPNSRGEMTLAEEQAELDLVDTYNGEDPAKSSIRKPSQLFEYKPGTDVILLGHAFPLPYKQTNVVDVALRVGPIAKTVRVHGFRVWQRGVFGGVSPGPAMPIKAPIPLTYELAWGGQDLSEPRKPMAEPRNYVGRGVARDTSALVDRAASQLDHPEHPAGSRSPVPAGFGPIHRHWQPRIRFAGTYNEEWQRARMPLLPADFDSRFHVCVPEDQWSPRPLRGDEPFEVLGTTPDGLWRFVLPRKAVGFSSVVLGKRTEHRTYLDTVLIDADSKRVELTYRAAIAAPRKLEMLDRILIFEKSLV